MRDIRSRLSLLIEVALILVDGGPSCEVWGRTLRIESPRIHTPRRASPIRNRVRFACCRDLETPLPQGASPREIEIVRDRAEKTHSRSTNLTDDSAQIHFVGRATETGMESPE